MKRILIMLTAIAVCSLSANAQLGKGLKNVGKTVGNAVGNAAAQVAEDMAADATANTVANNIVTWMDSSNPVAADDSPYTLRLAGIVSPKFLTADGVALNYKVFLDEEINILACANGSIRIYAGMMDALTDDEIAAVVATQIGHIVKKDTRNSLMKVATGGNATNATTAQLEKMLTLSGSGLGTIVNELIQIPYTEAQNNAADKYAGELLKSNSINPEALATALEKFAAMEANDQQAANDDDLSLSAANKYIRVSANNANRAMVIKSK